MIRFATIMLLLVITTLPAQAQDPPIDTAQLGRGRYGRMQALVEKTFLQVNVADVEVRFDDEVARSLERLSAGKEYSKERADRIAQIAFKAPNTYASVRFERDVSLDRFLKAARENMLRARKAGMITEANYRTVARGLPKWFGFLKRRGFVKGDRLLYRTQPNALRTVLVDIEGKELLDQTDRGANPRLALLGGYFAPGTDFREPLIRSLFDR